MQWESVFATEPLQRRPPDGLLLPAGAIPGLPRDHLRLRRWHFPALHPDHPRANGQDRRPRLRPTDHHAGRILTLTQRGWDYHSRQGSIAQARNAARRNNYGRSGAITVAKRAITVADGAITLANNTEVA